MTIQESVRSAMVQLSQVSDAPDLDAERLLLHVLGRDEISWLYAHGNEELSSKQEQKYRQLQESRLSGRPLAYLLGEWEFYGRSFLVNEDVLIPRPATENLVDEALLLINKIVEQRDRRVVVADVGTGSGCIAITLMLEASIRQIALHKVIATDISCEALSVAHENAKRHGVINRISFLRGDMLEPLQDRRVDLIISNPPYVPSKELARHRHSPTPQTMGLQFEPTIALNGGQDGQQYVRQLQNEFSPVLLETHGGEVVLAH